MILGCKNPAGKMFRREIDLARLRFKQSVFHAIHKPFNPHWKAVAEAFNNRWIIYWSHNIIIIVVCIGADGGEWVTRPSYHFDRHCTIHEVFSMNSALGTWTRSVRCTIYSQRYRDTISRKMRKVFLFSYFSCNSSWWCCLRAIFETGN